MKAGVEITFFKGAQGAGFDLWAKGRIRRWIQKLDLVASV